MRAEAVYVGERIAKDKEPRRERREELVYMVYVYGPAWPVLMILNSDWMLFALMAARHALTTSVLNLPIRHLAAEVVE